MNNWIDDNFDLSMWIKLAINDPFKFQHQRHQWLENAIRKAKPEQKPRLNGLLWEINMDLDIAKNKLHSCPYIANRIADHLSEFKDLLDGNLPDLKQFPATIFAFARREEHPN